MRFLSLVHRVLGVLLGFFLFGGWPRTFLLGGLIVLFRWRRTGKCVRVRARAQRSINAFRVRFRETAPRFGHVVVHTVLVPVANFVSVVASEVQNNLSARQNYEQEQEAGREVVREGDNAPEYSTQGERPGSESTAPGAPEIPTSLPGTRTKSPALFLAALIATSITVSLALADQASKFAHRVFSNIAHPQATTLRMDVYDTPATQTTTLELDAPGATPDAVDLSLYDGRLTIAVTIPSVPTPSIVPGTAIAPRTTADSDSMSVTSLSDSESTVTTTTTGTDAFFVVTDAPLDASSGRVYHRRERAGGRLTRTVQVPTGTKAEDLRASVADGVLKITFPMSSTHQPESIVVN